MSGSTRVSGSWTVTVISGGKSKVLVNLPGPSDTDTVHRGTSGVGGPGFTDHT